MGSWHSSHVCPHIPLVLDLSLLPPSRRNGYRVGGCSFVVHWQLGHALAVYRLLALLQPCLPLMFVVCSPAEMALPG